MYATIRDGDSVVATFTVDALRARVWTVVQAALRRRYTRATTITRISRDDEACNYSVPGTYTIEVHDYDTRTYSVTLSD